MFKKLFKKKENTETIFEQKHINASQNLEKLKAAGADLARAPLRMLYYIIITSYWVALALVFIGIIIAFGEPNIRAVVVNMIIEMLNKL